MKKTFLLTIAVAAVGAMVIMPTLSYGATYYYVDTAGAVKTVEARSAAEALVITEADRKWDSGVAVAVDNDVTVGTRVLGAMSQSPSPTGMTRYQYVDVTGNVKFVYAVNAQAAIEAPTDRAHDSGVVVAEDEVIPEDVEVNV